MLNDWLLLEFVFSKLKIFRFLFVFYCNNYCFFFIKRKALAIPIVDGIDWNTIEHQDIYGGSLQRGIFEWGFLYKETEVPAREKQKHKRGSEPYW